MAPRRTRLDRTSTRQHGEHGFERARFNTVCYEMHTCTRVIAAIVSCRRKSVSHLQFVKSAGLVRKQCRSLLVRPQHVRPPPLQPQPPPCAQRPRPPPCAQLLRPPPPLRVHLLRSPPPLRVHLLRPPPPLRGQLLRPPPPPCAQQLRPPPPPCAQLLRPPPPLRAQLLLRPPPPQQPHARRLRLLEQLLQ